MTEHFLVTFLPKDSGACPPDLVVKDAPAYSQAFAEQIARHLGIAEYSISLDTDRGWITNRRTRASRHFAYGPQIPVTRTRWRSATPTHR